MHKQISILCIAAAWILTGECAPVPVPGDGAVPEHVQLSSFFACFNLPGVDWAALEDAKNNRILHACLRGATRVELESLALPDLEERLRKLRDGRLICPSDETYVLAQPAVVGPARQELTSVIEKAALKVVPVAKRTVREIRPLLEGREEMVYHIIWSRIMDGPPAWDSLRQQLERDLKRRSGSVDLRTGWWIYPAHPFRAGTNTFGSAYGHLIITAQRGFTPAHTIRNDIETFKKDLIRSSITGGPLGGRAIPQCLRDYGLVGVDDRSRLFVVCSESDVVSVGARLSTAFVQCALANLDLESIAGRLNTTREQALVIAYHELCYEVLSLLSADGDVTIPNAAQASARAVRPLVSFHLMQPTKEFLGRDGRE